MNNLQFESSPYLNQHKANPVDWRTWSSDTLMEAKQLQKPMLVSIGYSTCHWCHVMAHESFEDPETAMIMNEYFINIKIDREERPDLDHYFMNAVQAMGISGGWPLHCFLSPDGKPFFGGTYFPPEAKYGRPSWKHILTAIHKAFLDKPHEICEQADLLFKHLNNLNKLENIKSEIDVEIEENSILKRLQSSMDLVHGGFGTQPKFPNTQSIQLLFHLYFLTGKPDAIHHALFSLKQIASGGIYDHIDGGFCRYSVDKQWNVPHFEKMLYDNAQLIQTLSIGYQYNKSPFFSRIIMQSIDFFERYMQDNCGLFYAAIDADSEGEEGSYYVWSEELLKETLGNDYKIFRNCFSLSSLDHIHTEKKVLRLRNTLTDDIALNRLLDTLDPILSKLKRLRNERVLPSIDKKMIVSWNAMMISALLTWYNASQDAIFLKKGEKLMQNLLSLTCKNETEICRYYIDGRPSGYAFLEDYAYVIKALLDIYNYTLNKSYIEKAIQLFEYVHLNFNNSNSSVYNVASSKQLDFSIQQLDWAESIYPNPNAILNWACKYFYEFTLNEKYLVIADSMLNAIRAQAIEHPLAMASWIQQLLIAKNGPIVLKTGLNHFENKILSELHIPGLIKISKDSNGDGLSFCFDKMCFQPVYKPEEIVSLFSKYKLQLEY